MSILFVGGPADGVGLEFTRTPYYLRVATNALGGHDVLDQLDDVPSDEETVSVYVRPGETELMTERPGVCTRVGTYVHLADVDGEQLRTTEAWRAWASAQPPAGGGRVGETRWAPPHADPVCTVDWCPHPRSAHTGPGGTCPEDGCWCPGWKATDGAVSA